VTSTVTQSLSSNTLKGKMKLIPTPSNVAGTYTCKGVAVGLLSKIRVSLTESSPVSLTSIKFDPLIVTKLG
jgi:hypothetical protein